MKYSFRTILFYASIICTILLFLTYFWFIRLVFAFFSVKRINNLELTFAVMPCFAPTFVLETKFDNNMVSIFHYVFSHQEVSKLICFTLCIWWSKFILFYLYILIIWQFYVNWWSSESWDFSHTSSVYLVFFFFVVKRILHLKCVIWL